VADAKKLVQGDNFTSVTLFLEGSLLNFYFPKNMSNESIKQVQITNMISQRLQVLPRFEQSLIMSNQDSTCKLLSVGKPLEKAGKASRSLS
jgi:hypothetical protein